ncbi:MAG: glycogen synthase [Chloroflexota bacterium]
MPKPVNVLFLIAEADPFVKVGGLGDVGAALPRALMKLPPDMTGEEIALDVRLVLPHHAVIKADARPVAIFSLPRAGGDVDVQVSETNLDGLTVYLIDGPPIKASGTVYSSNPALDAEKYAFFSLAALELPRHINWQPNVIHANDWHTALAVYALMLKRWKGESSAASVLTLHNLPFMGPDAAAILESYGLEIAQSDLPDWARAMPLPLGLYAADKIVPVSPTYAKEVLTPEFGCGLQDFLHRRREVLHGILNGIDAASYNPATDTNIPFQYTLENPMIREKNKVALQEKLGLPTDPGSPLLGVVSRMDPQKGVDLIPPLLRRITDIPWQVVILGAGDAKLEEAARSLQADLPDRVRAETRFDPALARMIYAGADIFLMPSRYEPCGLSQMVAMRYGCVPVVRAAGGLVDTVTEKTGFLFKKASPVSFRSGLLKALAAYSDRARWLDLQKAGMSKDFSWNRSAVQYFDLYLSLLEKG